MSLYRTLKDRGKAASDHYAGSAEYFSLTPASRSLLLGLRPVLDRHCRGRVLDAGTGRGAYRDLLKTYAEEYVGMDIAPSPATTAVGDAQRLPFAAASFDTVFCSQVLEHVPEPWLALSEFRRVLRPGGRLIPDGAASLLAPQRTPRLLPLYPPRAAFSSREGWSRASSPIEPAGGLLALLGHIPSTLWMNLTFGVPLLHPLVRGWNVLWGKGISFLDRHLDKKKLFALNYVCLAVKRTDPVVVKGSPS